MLVHYPHDLAGVHCGSTAQSDDGVGLEGLHLLHALLCALQCRVRSYLVEACMLNTHLVQFFLDRFHVAVLIQESICYDKCFLLVHDGSQLVQGNRHAAFLKVDLFWCSEPQHILSPLGHCLDIDEMFYSNVL